MILLAIESSCDDTAAAVLRDGRVLSNIIATQKVHEQFGGVVPEMASRAHMQNIVPVVEVALKNAGVDKKELSAIAFTQAPGLLGSLLVGACFAKSLALALGIPFIAVHHMQAHVLAHFIDEPKPEFPFLCLTVSGGHTQIVKVTDCLKMEILGETLDDAAGEAFDKTAKMLGLPYPGGPLIDKYAAGGNGKRFPFPVADIKGYDFSFSGLKTAVMYFLQKNQKVNPEFITQNLFDICASIQHTIIKTLLQKLERAADDYGIQNIGIAGGVSANSGLRKALQEAGLKKDWNVFLPAFEYCTDNAAMIGMAGYFKFLKADFAGLDCAPAARAQWL